MDINTLKTSGQILIYTFVHEPVLTKSRPDLSLVENSSLSKGTGLPYHYPLNVCNGKRVKMNQCDTGLYKGSKCPGVSVRNNFWYDIIFKIFKKFCLLLNV